jgi:ribosome-binding protein aMBF1 (putative translation factor)
MSQLEMFDDEMHEAYGAMMHRGKVEQAQSALPLPVPKKRPGKPPHPRPGTPALFRELREERVRRGLPQKVMAHELGVCENYLGKLELGINNPSFERVEKWVKALGYELVLRRLEGR